jgi:UDP-galactopyranose mutase
MQGDGTVGYAKKTLIFALVAVILMMSANMERKDFGVGYSEASKMLESLQTDTFSVISSGAAMLNSITSNATAFILPGTCDVSLLGQEGCKEYDIIVVGAGLSGAVIADMYARFLNKTVLVIDKRNHLGGNCHDYVDKETGIRASMYGPHVLHTDMEHVWGYMHRFGAWTRHDYRVMAKIDDQYVPIPINPATTSLLVNYSIDSPSTLREWLAKERASATKSSAPGIGLQSALSLTGAYIHEKILRPYAQKLWGASVDQITAEVLARDVPFTEKWDGRFYANDTFQGLPLDGYTSWFQKIFDHSNIHVVLGVDYFQAKNHVKRAAGGKTFFSGRVDEYVRRITGADLPVLPYRGVHYKREVAITPSHIKQPAPIVLYPQLEDGGFVSVYGSCVCMCNVGLCLCMGHVCVCVMWVCVCVLVI